MAGFWNAIGLPNVEVIQNLVQLCQQQSQKIEMLEAEIQILQTTMQTLQNNMQISFARTADHQNEQTQAVSQTIQAGFEQQKTELEKWQKEQGKRDADAQRKNTALHQKTQKALADSAKNQDELLRILIVDSLEYELDETINSER